MPTTGRSKNRRRNSRAARVAVQFACHAPGAPAAARLRAFARAAANAGSCVTLRVAGAAETRRLNRTYRGRDEATNVLSFAYPRATVGAARDPRPGDIVLCHPVIAREARAQRKSLEAHYAHLVVHGMLHLGGFDHQRMREALRMQRKETAILARLGFGDPYACERA